jgi:hypothetical protein
MKPHPRSNVMYIRLHKETRGKRRTRGVLRLKNNQQKSKSGRNRDNSIFIGDSAPASISSSQTSRADSSSFCRIGSHKYLRTMDVQGREDDKGSRPGKQSRPVSSRLGAVRASRSVLEEIIWHVE